MELYIKSSYLLTSEDEEAIKQMQTEMEAEGLPTASKIGIGFLLFRSFPFYNKNYHAITKETIFNSISSSINPKINFNHVKNDILGNIIKFKIYNNADVMRVYGYGTIDRDALAIKGISPNELPNLASSIETKFNNWDYFIPALDNKIVLREDIPELDDKIDDLIEGKPVFYRGYRVGLLWGGVVGKVDISGHSILQDFEPADCESGVLMAVAKTKINKNLMFEEENIDQTFNYDITYLI